MIQLLGSYYRMCSLTKECVLLLKNAFSYYRMCSLKAVMSDTVIREQSLGNSH